MLKTEFHGSALSFEDQIKLLRSQGLEIADEKKALRVRAVVSRSGDILAMDAYGVYGALQQSPLLGSTTLTAAPTGTSLRYHYTGQEDLSFDFTLPYTDFGARQLSPGLRHWLVQDKNSEKYYDLSPYVYCAGDPVNLVDPDGNWNVKVQANEDRSISSYAIFSVYSDDNLLLFRTVVRVQGSSRDRGTKNADTPTGTYRILGWRETGPGTSYDAISYGVNDLLALDYIEGEAAENRNGIHVHGGRDQSTELKPTLGCIRMNDHDLWEFKLLMALLEQIDPKEKGGTLFVENTIDYPIYYEEREIYNQSVVTGDITPAIIYSETPTNVTPEKEDKQ